MERLSIEEIIKHCNRHLDRFPSGTRNYQEHESTRAYLQMLRHYQKIGTVEEFAAYKQADSERRLVELPCKVGTPYAGICREQFPTHKGWKTESWVEAGEIKGFEVIAHMSAEKAGYDHSRSVDELNEVWFVGENSREAAEAALAEKGEKE